jgi:hypothetical protein
VVISLNAGVPIFFVILVSRVTLGSQGDGENAMVGHVVYLLVCSTAGNVFGIGFIDRDGFFEERQRQCS